MNARFGFAVWRVACLIVPPATVGAAVDRVKAEDPLLFTLSLSGVPMGESSLLFQEQGPEEPREMPEERLSLDEEEVTEESGEFRDDSGNDPRDFRNKFMPYYRYTELRNGLQAHEWTLFGFYAFTPRIGMTFELPAFKYVDASDAVPGGFRFNPPGPIGGPGIPGFAASRGPNADAHQFGMGDLILRFFIRPEATEWYYDAPGWSPRSGTKMNISLLPLIETTVPTNTDDLLGSDTWILSPGFAVVGDTPTMGFLAAMFFYDFNAAKDSDEPYVSRFRARIFLLQPFSKPGPGLFDGLYMMPEFQPIYDLREQRFSLWIGPEFGKIFLPEGGSIESIAVYAKPGWGWNKDSFGGDREFTFETGVRISF
ncbi:MAG: hypothetical protein JSU68_15150 [Phycisphaerales bacterium]|nr:MAG: hypothetical protein JSU68_15150 [Phycisphaerales bacterium]